MASELASTVAQERARVLELETALAPRRQSEAATLAALERELHELSERRAIADARTHDADEQRRQLSRELTRLQDGLSRARRAWVRLVVPVVGSAACWASSPAAEEGAVAEERGLRDELERLQVHARGLRDELSRDASPAFLERRARLTEELERRQVVVVEREATAERADAELRPVADSRSRRCCPHRCRWASRRSRPRWLRARPSRRSAAWRRWRSPSCSRRSATAPSPSWVSR